MAARFELFGAAHAVAVGVITALAVGLARAARSEAREPLIRAAVAFGLVASVALFVGDAHAAGRLDPWHLLPFHLCDMAILVALFALATKHRGATELLFFWTLTGTLLATITPALHRGFPSVRFVTYFALHGGVIVAAAVLVFGAGLRVRPGAAWRAWAATNAYAALVLAVNLAFDRNYLFLLGKPRQATLLDLMGPWPVYLAVAEGIALAAFGALERAARAGAGCAARPRPRPR